MDDVFGLWFIVAPCWVFFMQAGLCHGGSTGLVGITAGCAYVDAGGALVIGLVRRGRGAGLRVYRQELHIDDPVGAAAACTASTACSAPS